VRVKAYASFAPGPPKPPRLSDSEIKPTNCFQSIAIRTPVLNRRFKLGFCSRNSLRIVPKQPSQSTYAFRRHEDGEKIRKERPTGKLEPPDRRGHRPGDRAANQQSVTLSTTPLCSHEKPLTRKGFRRMLCNRAPDGFKASSQTARLAQTRARGPSNDAKLAG
jgi:hypothetical protein